MHLLSLVAVRKILCSQLLTRNMDNFVELSKMLRFGGWVSFAAVIALGITPFNRVVLSRYAGIAKLPLYEIAYGSAMRVRSLLDSGLRAMMPEISRISAPLTQDTLRRAGTMQRSGLRLIAGLGVPLFGGVALLATPLLHLWLRSQFQPALPTVFRIMLLASFLSLLGVPAYYILLGLGEARACFFSAAIIVLSSVATIGVALVLTGSVTVIDVAIGTTVGMGAGGLFLLWRVRQLRPSWRPSVEMPSVALSEIS
jgi:O-antigen/teichoic acid export membrane protein